MFGRRGWFGGWGSKPRNLHSTEHLKYLYAVLCKNQVVTEQNKDLLVETLRSISEILIWGDQNDGSVFDFFLEKNMLSYFVKIMRHKQGRFVCTQLLQTLNILFENIRQDTSLYYLLSNNHVNSIIVHKFDFTDEEVMAYYISFIKTLSLKLTSHTIHFFYNEHTNDFPLYTEAIKFFKHPESMVRIAVRTLTLNVFKVQDEAMQRFIRDKTAAPYFSNLVWFIGKNVLELDTCVAAAATDHKAQGRLADLVAEHLDQLHYLNDILCLNIAPLNEVLTDHLLNRLFLPLYIYSLTGTKTSPASRTSPHVSPILALFLLNQVFLIISHRPLVRQLADVLFNGTMEIFNKDNTQSSNGDSTGDGVATTGTGSLALENYSGRFRPEFIPPEEPLELSLQSTSSGTPSLSGSGSEAEETDAAVTDVGTKKSSKDSLTSAGGGAAVDFNEVQPSNQIVVDVGRENARFTPTSKLKNDANGSDVVEVEEGEEAVAMHTGSNITDEEKIRQQGLPLSVDEPQTGIAREVVANNSSLNSQHFSLSDGVSSGAADDEAEESDNAILDLHRRPFLSAIFDALNVENSDHGALFALSLLYALGHNSDGINQELLDTILLPAERCAVKDGYNGALMTRLMRIIRHACVYGTRVRLATLEMAILLIKQLAVIPADAQRTPSPMRPQSPQESATSRSSPGSEALPDNVSRTLLPALVSGNYNHCSNNSEQQRQQSQQQQSTSCLREAHLYLVKRARDESALLLKGFLKSDEIFLDMFEEEYEQGLKALNVEYLMMDGNLLLPPIGTPMSGLDFHKRLPCGEVERAIRAIRAFFLIRHLCLVLRGEAETELPLTKESDLVRVGQVLDLTNNDLVACTVYTIKDNSKLKRFMVIDSAQVILVKPEATRLGFGVVRLAGLLQDIEVTGDQHDSRALHITIHRASCEAGGRQGGAGSGTASRAAAHGPPKRPPLLAAKFIFDDHIRCMAAKQKLTKGRLRARQKKMQQIAKLLDMNISSASPTPGLPVPLLGAPGSMTEVPGGHRLLSRSGSGSTSSDSSHLPRGDGGPAGGTGVTGRSSTHRSRLATEYAFYEAQPVFGSGSRMGESTVRPKIPGSAVPAFVSSSRTSGDRRRVTSLPVDIKDSRRKQRSMSRSRESSPRTFPADEEIPLEDLSGHSSPRFSRGGSPLCSPTRQLQQQLNHQRSSSFSNTNSSGCGPYVNGVHSNHCDNTSSFSHSTNLVNGANTGTISDKFIQEQQHGPPSGYAQSPSGARNLCETSLDQLMGPSRQSNPTATPTRGQVYDI
ncbi:protein CLEC16A-like isoform X4 [Varroa destructor]|uniref:Protein CLEC16A n=1 Tax=Varroa destructor TaxID=109461 RepID=A0A7M7JZF9_VARDE|nr:protein CLEC16A-like isoform X4 [Varroa destructor]